MELFEKFCWAVYNRKVKADTIFSPNADNVELMSFSRRYHASRINSEGTTTTILEAVPTGGDGGNFYGNLEVLTSTLTKVIVLVAGEPMVLTPCSC